MHTAIDVFSDAAASHQLFLQLVSIVAKGAFILAATGIVAALLRNSAASLRHMIWMCGLAAVLLLPAMTFLLPEWSVPIIPERLADLVDQDGDLASQASTTATVLRADVQPLSHTHGTGTNSWTIDWQSGSISFGRRESTSADPSAKAGPDEIATAESDPGSIVVGNKFLSSGSLRAVVDNLSRLPWSAWAILVWLAGGVVLMGRLVVAHLSVLGLVRRAERVDDDESQLALEEAASQLGVRQYVRLRQSDWLSVPVSVGLRHPTIVLPADADKWDSETRRTVLLHELAHVQRRDCLIQLFVEMTRAFFWVNPMVWVAAHHMKYERERACDDAVIVSGTTPSSYAQALLDIARSITDRELSGAAVMAMARKSELEGRLLDILDPNPKLRTVNKAAAIISVAVILSFALPVSVLKLAAARNLAEEDKGDSESDSLHELHWLADGDDHSDEHAADQAARVADHAADYGAHAADRAHEQDVVVVWESMRDRNSRSNTNESQSHRSWAFSSDKNSSRNTNRDSFGNPTTTYKIKTDNKRTRTFHFDSGAQALAPSWDEKAGEFDEVDQAIALLSNRIKSLESVLESPVFDSRTGPGQSDSRRDSQQRHSKQWDSKQWDSIPLNTRKQNLDSELENALNKFKFEFSSSDVLLLERSGVDADLVVSVAKAGLRFCPSEFVVLAKAGVDEDLIDVADRSGYRFSAKEFALLAKAGVDEDLLRYSGKAGYRFSAQDFALLANAGVDEDLVRYSGKAGYRFSAKDFVALQDSGVDEDLIVAIGKAGYRFSAKDLAVFAGTEVDADLFRVLKRAGIVNASAESIVRMAKNDFCMDCISELISVVGNQFALDEIERLYENGVDAKFLCEMSEKGLLSVGVDRLIDLSKRTSQSTP